MTPGAAQECIKSGATANSMRNTDVYPMTKNTTGNRMANPIVM